MYRYKEKYIIDFSEVTDYFHMHRIIADELDFPQYYGFNWDALWDCLTDMIGWKVYIEIRGLEVLRQRCGDDADMLCKILKDFKHVYNDTYSYRIRIDIVIGENRTTLT